MLRSKNPSNRKPPELKSSRELRRSLTNNRGQSLIEYLLLTALLAVGTMAVVRVVGQSVAGKYAEIANTIQGKTNPRVKFDEVRESQYKKRDMSDFLNGATAEKQK